MDFPCYDVGLPEFFSAGLIYKSQILQTLIHKVWILQGPTEYHVASLDRPI